MENATVIKGMLTCLLAAVALYGLVRLMPRRFGGHPDPRGHVEHVLSATGMAVMLWPIDPVPPLAWEALYTGAALAFLAWRWSSSRTARPATGHDLHHVVACAAMAEMVAASGRGPSAAMAGMAMRSGSGGSLDLLTGALAVYFFGYALWWGASTLGLDPAPAWGRAAPVPALSTDRACRCAMGTAMGLMLLAAV